MHPHRCTTKRCRKRVSLRRPVPEYVREPRCKACGGRLAPDPSVKRRGKKKLCHCNALEFPHQAGSTPMCVQHPTGPTEADWEDFYRRFK